jgi:hypothetical protein
VATLHLVVLKMCQLGNVHIVFHVRVFIGELCSVRKIETMSGIFSTQYEQKE